MLLTLCAEPVHVHAGVSAYSVFKDFGELCGIFSLLNGKAIHEMFKELSYNSNSGLPTLTDSA